MVIGKTNMDEFAMGSTTETSAYGATRNPRNTEHVPGLPAPLLKEIKVPYSTSLSRFSVNGT